MNTLFDLTQVDRTLESACDEGMEKLLDALNFMYGNEKLFADQECVDKLSNYLQRGYARLRHTKAQPKRVNWVEPEDDDDDEQ